MNTMANMRRTEQLPTLLPPDTRSIAHEAVFSGNTVRLQAELSLDGTTLSGWMVFNVNPLDHSLRLVCYRFGDGDPPLDLVRDEEISAEATRLYRRHLAHRNPYHHP